MSSALSKRCSTEQRLQTAESLRSVLSRWVRMTRDRAGTPSSAKIETLRLLQGEGSASIALLAKRRSVKHQSMRLVVDQLAAEGAVEKNTDPKDRRSQIVCITNKGRSIIQREQSARTAWIADLLGECSQREREQVEAAVNTLESLLHKTTPSD